MYLPKAKLVKYFSGTIEAFDTWAHIPDHLAHIFGHIQNELKELEELKLKLGKKYNYCTLSNSFYSTKKFWSRTWQTYTHLFG